MKGVRLRINNEVLHYQGGTTPHIVACPEQCYACNMLVDYITRQRTTGARRGRTEYPSAPETNAELLGRYGPPSAPPHPRPGTRSHARD